MSDITRLYRGPLEDFVARRDALAKERRASGDRDGAAQIKSIRKPSRNAWALSCVSDTVEFKQLLTTVHAVVRAQSKGGDVRDAMTAMWQSVRAFVHHAAEVAGSRGQKLETSDLMRALLAVLADPAAFGMLQRGELGEIPEGGGLDFLATMTPPPVLTVSSGNGAREQSAKKGSGKRDAAAAQHDESGAALARAEAELAAHRKATDQALRDLNAAESELSRAEQNLEQATRDAEAARNARDRARTRSADAARLVKAAEKSVAKLKS